MDELVEQVAAALTAEYSGAPNGRVRDLPDRRAIRWYTTTGLVDRPLGMRGRTALYGRRHLLQLVAVKRRQAQGHTLAAIQAELHGASDAVLADVARVPEEVFAGGGQAADPDAAPARPRFWATPPAAPPAAPAPKAARHDPARHDPARRDTAVPDTARADAAGHETAGHETAGHETAGDDTAGETNARADARDDAAPDEAAQDDTGAADAARDGVAPDEVAAEAAPIGAVRLRGGAVLVLPGQPTAADRAAIAAAAEPLLALLADRGLLKFDEESAS